MSTDGLRDKIVHRIAKLLRRAERDDGPEADTARALAERLMSKHGVDVQLHELDAGPEPLVHERMVMFLRSRDTEVWAQFLLQELAPLYSCVNRQEQSDDVGWMFYVMGAAAQVELCAIHFEYLRRKVQMMAGAICQSMQNPMSPFPLTYRARDAIHWGVMDGLRARLAAKLANRMPDVAPPSETHTVTVLDNRKALPSADHVAVRGTEIAVCQPGDVPFELPFDPPPDVTTEEPPRWAWNIGFSSVDELADPEPPEIVYAPIVRLDLPDDVVGALSAHDVRIVAQLVRMRPSSILQVDGIHERHVIQIIQALGAHGLLLPAELETDVA